MVTIKEIAERAGVSTTTVSNVIHGKTKKVSAENIKKIQALIQEMGYVQRMGFHVLHNDRSQLIAVVVNAHKIYDETILADPFYGKIVGIIEHCLHSHNYYMMFYASEDIDDIFRMIMTWDVDGVVALTLSRSNCEKMYSIIHKPIVSIDAHPDLSGNLQVPNFGIENEEGGYLMTRYLLEQGYQNIFVCSHKDYGIDHARWDGAQRAWQESTSQKKRKLQFDLFGDTWDSRKAYYRKLHSHLPFKHKTAAFFLADFFAIEAINYLTSHGAKVPEQIGIAGFDDIVYASRLSSPRLTTIHQDIAKRAELAIEELVHALNDPDYVPMDQNHPVSLIIRSSV